MSCVPPLGVAHFEITISPSRSSSFRPNTICVASTKARALFAANNARAFVDATQIVLGLKLEDRNGEIVISK